MQSRESIPNVGRRAQGRKAFFMLKGSGVGGPGSSVEQDGDHRTMQDSLTVYEDENGDNAMTYDESVLRQPSHPYNRIIERILYRHRMDQSTGDTHNLTHRSAYDDEERPYTPSTLTRQKRFCSSDPQRTASSRLTGTDLPHDCQLSGEESTDDMEREHCSGSGRETEACGMGEDKSLRIPLRDVTPSDDQSLELARGYLTDRSHARKRGRHARDSSHDRLESARCESLDATRSAPGDTCLPRLRRPRGSRALEEALDYLWVYQGMNRQVLSSGAQPHSHRTMFKRPTKLPPIYISQGRKAAGGSSSTDGTNTSGSLDGVEGVGQPPGRRRSNSEPRHVTGSHLSRDSPASSDLGSEPSECSGDDSTHSGCEDTTLESTARSEVDGSGNGGRGRVTLVVKMPVLTQDPTSSDLLDND